MLTAEENEMITRVGAGTPMGKVMREHWMPAFMSSELDGPDGSPLRVRLLGENLIAFRSTSGKIGLLANNCPHRGASLYFGRNEEEGLRCIYHGWKFDTEGRCLDMPAEPPESDFKDKVRAVSYPTHERNGVVWAYMGPRSEPPPLPDLEPNMQEGETYIWTSLRRCNWLQALEGDIDHAHVAFMHLGTVLPEDVEAGSFDYYTVRDRQPRYKVMDTEGGTSYGAYRPADDDQYYWRMAHFLFPFYTFIPTGILGAQILVQIWVPVDDEHTMFWHISKPVDRDTAERTGSTTLVGSSNIAGSAGGPRFLPNTTGWLGRWRLADHLDNDYNIDREVQRSSSFTGIDGVNLQDQAVTESMGSIADRTKENLGTGDLMIARTRRRMIRACLDMLEGTPPTTVDKPELYRTRSGGILLPRSVDWWEGTAHLREAFVEHPELAAHSNTLLALTGFGFGPSQV
jgi:nitrite reductase/ring-hydroxylating ferredoxin subunit